jgi:hypothetical protein
MFELLKLSHHKHSGRLRPHEHTSYVPLALIVLITGVILLTFSRSSVLADHPPPQSASVSLTGTMPEAPPKTGAVITLPTDQKHFSTSPVTVSGTCPDNTLIEIYKNNIFAGSTPCSGGTFAVDVDMLYGQNTLTAQVYDVLNQAGPVSSPVTVFYDVAPPSSAALNLLNFSGSQLLLESNPVYRGSFPGQTLNVPITILGGVGPYAVNVEWGDTTNKVLPHADNTVFNATHVYQKAGVYKITLQASDSAQQVAFLTVAAIINGQPSVLGTTTPSSTKPVNKLLVLWPLYAIIATMVLSFWVGERREKHMLDALNPKNNPTLGVASPRPPAPASA